MKSYSIFCNKYRKFKNRKISYIFRKTLNLSIVCSKYDNEYRKNFKKRIESILGLISNIEKYQ